MNTRTSARFRSVVAGTVALLVAAGALFGGSAAMASPADDIIGGTVVGGNSGPSYYRAAGSFSSTTCNAADDSVTTTVQATARQYSGRQLFSVRILARDVTNGVGAWTQYANKQFWVAETYSAGLPQRYTVGSTRFIGYQGHAYQVYSEVYVLEGSTWQLLGTTQAHYSTFGAYESNVYGRQIQAMRGSGSWYCLVL